MGQCKLQNAPEEILRNVLRWVLPSTESLWGATLALDPPNDGERPPVLKLLPIAHVCQAWRAAVQQHVWKHIRLSTVHGIHRLEVLTGFPWLRNLIKNVAVELSWDTALNEVGSDGNWHSEIRGELEDYFFRDRQEVLNRLVEAGYAGQDEDDYAYFEDGKLLEFTQGPDGIGFHPVIKNADDAIKSLETSILRLREMQRFVWQTFILPMPSSVCHHLSQLESLRLLRLEQQGEFRSSKRLPAPLWEIFGPGKQLDALGLNIRVLPLYTNMSYETAFDEESHTLTRAIRHEYVDAEIPLHNAERLFSEDLDALPPMERPLAMAMKLLERCANTDRVRFVCLKDESECLLRFRHLAHIWIKLPITTVDAMLAFDGEPHSNRWLSAANGLRPALMEVASRKEDQSLNASDIASLPDAHEELEAFADWLREDQQVQKRMADTWNGIVHDGKAGALPLAFSVQLVNPPNNSRDDRWIEITPHDYGPV